MVKISLSPSVLSPSHDGKEARHLFQLAEQLPDTALCNDGHGIPLLDWTFDLEQGDAVERGSI